MHKHFSYCGLYCGACSGMIVHEQQQGDPSVQDIKIPSDETPCSGCCNRTDEDCEIIRCNIEHGSECCAFCPEFPCQVIRNFNDEEWVHHCVVLDNHNRIKEIGIDAWLEEQKMFWSCQNCRSRTHWYQTHCETCGNSWEPVFQ